MNLRKMLTKEQKIERINRYDRSRDWSVALPQDDSKRKQMLLSAISGSVNLKIYSTFPHFLLCALPKSASLFLTDYLGLIFGLKVVQVGFDQGGGTLYYPRLATIPFMGEATISHCHEPLDGHLQTILKHLDLRPIILTRNLFDVIVSRTEMLIRDGYAPEISSDEAMARFLKASFEEQVDWVIDSFLPIYCNFISSWTSASRSRKAAPLFLKYEDYVADSSSFLKHFSTATGLSFDPEIAEKANARIQALGGVNFNKGVVGRGTELLTDSQQQRIRAMVERFGIPEYV